jgi:RNA polymerase sigma-70 factor (ECF subfamily)
VEQLKELIEGCINNNRQSQSKLYGLLAPKMFGVCLRYAQGYEEAEDVLQEGFVKVFEYIHQYRHSGPFEAWVRKIMVNTALQKHRSKRHLHAVATLDDVAVELPGNEEIIARIGTKELLKIVQQLPPSYRTVFNLYVFEGFKHREIAELLGITEGTSKSNLSDARAILQKAVYKSLQSVKPNMKEV